MLRCNYACQVQDWGFAAFAWGAAIAIGVMGVLILVLAYKAARGQM